jgi:chemotaxis protein CheC
MNRYEKDVVSSDILLDIVREIINIGMGEAANALSRLVNNRVVIRSPDVRVIDLAAIHDYIRDQVASIGVYISQNFSTLVKGRTILFYTRECSISLLNSVYGGSLKTSTLTESGIATLNEIGNIIMGSCMAEISNAIQGKITFDLPQVTVEVSEKYFQNLIRELGDEDRAIVVKNMMRIKDTDIQGYLFVLLTFDDFMAVVRRMERGMKL